MRIKKFDMNSRSLSTNKITAPPKETNQKNIRNTSRWRRKRDDIKERDGYFCQRCWSKYNLRTNDTLEVHHIKSYRDFPELAFDDNNLITICHCCNMQLGNSNKLDFEWNRENTPGYWIEKENREPIL